MKKILIAFFCFSLFASFDAIAQTKTVTGKVTGKQDGAVIQAVSVTIKGADRGTQTNADGIYSIEVKNGDILQFSFIGKKTYEVKVGSGSLINVSLEESAESLTEVIVTGYGKQTRQSVTGSIATIKSEKLEQVPFTSFEQSLQGNVAGLQLTSSDGAPGAGTNIRIRGIGSISASSEPLYVIDGIPIQSGSIAGLNGNSGRSSNVMASLNPNDIETITIMKDPSSTAIYGSRGANGVILITTKSGKSGKIRLELKSQVGFNSIATGKFSKPLTAEQYTQLYLEGYTNAGQTLAQAQTRFNNTFKQLTDPSTGQPTDTRWLDAITRTGVNHSYDLSGSGGSDNTKYFFSMSYFDQESYIIGSDFNRLSARMNIESKVNDNITIANRLNVSNFNQNGFTDGSAWANPIYNAFLLSPLIPIKDEFGLYNDQHKNYFPMGGNNPVGALSGDDQRLTTQFRLTDNFSVDYKFLKKFTFRTQWNVDLIQVDESNYKNQRYGDGRNLNGYAEENATLNKNWVGTQTLNYINKFGGRHNVNTLLGYEAQKSNRKTLYGFGQNFPNAQLRTLASAADGFSASSTLTQYTFNSIFARVNYDYEGKYFVDGSFRRDGSSRFGSETRYGNFWSAGLAWALHKEDFMYNVNFVDQLKLRASYGITGNAEIGNFPGRGLYGYGRDYDGLPGGEPSQIANPLVTWESMETLNIGMDLSLFKRVDLSVDYFNKVNSDLLLNVPLPRSIGFGSVLKNFGDMSNKGIEVLLNVAVINKKDFSLDFGFNTSILNNKINKLESPYIDGTKRREEGRDYQEFYLFGWAGVDQSNGKPLWYTDETETATTSSISKAKQYYVGKSATPDFYGGFNINLRYKDLSLTSQFTYSAGNYIYDSEGRFLMGDGSLTPRSTTLYAFENRWLPGKTNAIFPQHKWGGNSSSNVSNSSRWLLDGTFARLRNATLSYNLSPDIASKLKLRSAQVYLRGTNLFTWTKDKNLYLDPEADISGISASLTPAIKSITFGINVGL